MSNNNEINMHIKKKHLTIVIIAIIATSMIIPYQIFAQNQAIPTQATEPVNSPPVIGAGTPIFIMISNIVNPAALSNTCTVTTRNAVPAIIDGPTASAIFSLKKVGTAQLLTGAVTLDKMASSSVDSSKVVDGSITGADVSTAFMKNVVLTNDAAGNAVGWTPNGFVRTFTIFDGSVTDLSNIIIGIDEPGPFETCGTNFFGTGAFFVVCSSAPSTSAALHYTVINEPSTIVLGPTASLSAPSGKIPH